MTFGPRLLPEHLGRTGGDTEMRCQHAGLHAALATAAGLAWSNLARGQSSTVRKALRWLRRSVNAADASGTTRTDQGLPSSAKAAKAAEARKSEVRAYCKRQRRASLQMLAAVALRPCLVSVLVQASLRHMLARGVAAVALSVMLAANTSLQMWLRSSQASCCAEQQITLRVPLR